jgi:hypothetical protein
MISNKTRILIRILFTAAILLVISDLVLDKLLPVKLNNRPPVSEHEADSVFLNTLNSFGIEFQWLTKKGSKYTARIPLDIPSEVIMMDISHSFSNRNLTVNSVELIRGSKSRMILHSGNDEVLSVEFIYDKTKKRKISTISFILLDAGKLNEKVFNDLLNGYDNFNIALVPSRKNREIASLLASKGKEYSLLINSDINELEYKLDDKFSDRKLKITVETITAHFSKAVYFILDDITSIYSKRVNNILENELNKRKIRYRHLNDFNYIPELSSPEELLAYVDMPGDQVFTINAADFIRYKNGLSSIRKRGIKVSNLSALVL